MTRLRLTLALLAALLCSPAFAQDISNPQCSGAWTSYTSTITAQTPGGTPPTFTLNDARYKICGNKTVIALADATVTAAGTGTGAMLFSLPFTAAAFRYVGSSFEYVAAFTSGNCLIPSSGTTMNCRNGAGATYIVTGQAIAAEITYEIP